MGERVPYNIDQRNFKNKFQYTKVKKKQTKDFLLKESVIIYFAQFFWDVNFTLHDMSCR